MTLALLGLHLAVTGALLPRWLTRSARLQARLQTRPTAAAALWLALMASFLVALLLAAHHTVEPFAHEPAGLVGLFPHTEPTGAVLPHTHDWWLLAAAGAVPGTVAAAVGVRAGRVRRRHRALLDVVAVRDGRWDALVLEHARPTVYCLPGRRSRVVLSRGALRLLDERQLAAAVAHEHGHLRGRHHLFRLPADTFALLFGRLPLARLGRAQVALLLEMAADDAALARASRTELASALCVLATSAGPPEAALAVASTGVLARVQRLARPGPAHRRDRLAWRTAVLAAPLLPYLLACAPHP
ncbi:M56 family metallopeptidase [Kitasatospora sp. NPDC004745]|uniref:M56 family metallopeptidase n=1 Tax=Kitasatospora sp. NPDC004745 TaxID=3364019 RepID=UPI00368E2DD0